MTPFKWAVEFSFYLRRRWDMSHFTIAMVAYAAAVLLVMPRLDILWIRVMLVAAVVAISWRCMQLARDHNKPGNTPAFLPWVFGLVIVVVDTTNIVTTVIRGDYMGIVQSVCSIVAWVLLCTPGYKVPHEPDNLNYAPGAA